MVPHPPERPATAALSLHAHAVALGRAILGDDFFQSEEVACRKAWQVGQDDIAAEILTLLGDDAKIYGDIVAAFRAVAVAVGAGGRGLADDAVRVSLEAGDDDEDG